MGVEKRSNRRLCLMPSLVYELLFVAAVLKKYIQILVITNSISMPNYISESETTVQSDRYGP